MPQALRHPRGLSPRQPGPKTCPNRQLTTLGASMLLPRVFFSHMKTEVHYQQHFANHLAARTAVMEYIESWYNRHRPHSHNGGLQPAAALAAHRDRYQKATT
ncbi:IS3 family transposase [Cryobacterium serini]|uniref:Integrase catalytic domain-containing protein n=1 Tax=Cryobacterium serini TaxID=1259201 RepID=A0A4R9BK83_9MICO|nr:hypothetical protein E3T51_14965 [Cryobacterium serini]